MSFELRHLQALSVSVNVCLLDQASRKLFHTLAIKILQFFFVSIYFQLVPCSPFSQEMGEHLGAQRGVATPSADGTRVPAKPCPEALPTF